MDEAMKLVWAQRLEDLAERLHSDLEECRGTDPFAKSAVVVSHALRGEWLKEYHLFSRERAARKILAGFEVKALHPFVGDWLHAALERKDPRARRPSSHPYSMEVLRWRIDGLLGELETSGALGREFPALEGYLRGAWRGRGEAEVRRSALAEKLAAMFGDYQSHRPEMLARWERGEVAGEEAARWQAALWRRLRRQGGVSLREQFERVEKGADLSVAFVHGIPRYASVHVFGVSSMPRPYVSFFARLAEVVPVTVYAFNPSEAFWMEDPDWRRAWRTAMAEAASGGDGAGPTALERMADLAHPLLGTLGAGCKGLLAELLDRLEGNFEGLTPGAEGEGEDTVLLRLQGHLRERSAEDERGNPVAAGDSSVSVHRASTPRREMEVVRDGLLGWFAAHPGAHPRDAMVLCADWETYAPHAEAVFGGGASGLPCTLLGRGAADDPVAEAFLSLLKLAESRMEAGAVLDLLGEPAVAAGFGIGAEDVPALREFVRAANIRWGLDDAHVEEVMAEEGGRAEEGERRSHAFTWRRGLDRLLLSALGGVEDGEESPRTVEAGALGGLLPAGDAEAERAALLGRLCGYVGALSGLRALAAKEGTAEQWQEQVLGVITDFFRETDENHRSVAALREAVTAVAARMREADGIAGGAPARHGWRVVAAAVAELVRGEGGRAPRTPDAVLFAPLRAGMPSPRRFVWICGLNDRVFPRNPQRPAFDLMGRHPAPLDPSPRDDDALALLEAVCCARDALALSHLGRNPHTGEAVPPAPLAGALLDYLAGHFAVEGRKVPYTDTVHPLHGFSPRCFTAPRVGEEVRTVPYSAEDRAAAMAIAGVVGRGCAAGEPGVFMYLPEGREEIGLDELAEVFANPSKAVLKRFASVKDPKYEAIDSDDALEADGALGRDPSLALAREMPEEEVIRRGSVAAETGLAPTPEKAETAILGEWEARRFFRERALKPKDCKEAPVPVPGEDGLLSMLEDARPVEIRVRATVPLEGGRSREVAVAGNVVAVERHTAGGGTAWYAPRLARNIKYPYGQAEAWIRHLAVNAGGLNATSVLLSGTATSADSSRKEEIQVLPPMEKGEAAARLGRILALLCEPFPGAVPFHPAASQALASNGAALSPSRDFTAGEIRHIVEKAWFGGWTGQDAEPPPGRPGLKAEDAALWPESPSALPDAWLAKYAKAARAFWEGFPYLPRPRGSKPAPGKTSKGKGG